MKPGTLHRYQGLRTFTRLQSSAKLLRRSEIRKQSSKKRRELRFWKRITLQLITAADGECQALTPDCKFFATEGHHKQRRSQLGPSTSSNCLVCCPACHTFIHDHPQWSRDRGFIVSGHSPERTS